MPHGYGSNDPKLKLFESPMETTRCFFIQRNQSKFKDWEKKKYRLQRAAFLMAFFSFIWRKPWKQKPLLKSARCLLSLNQYTSWGPHRAHKTTANISVNQLDNSTIIVVGVALEAGVEFRGPGLCWKDLAARVQTLLESEAACKHCSVMVLECFLAPKRLAQTPSHPNIKSLRVS